MTFEKELENLLNRYSKEIASNTPDFILAAYISDSLDAFNAATKERDRWYGRTVKIFSTSSAASVSVSKEK